MGAPQRVAIVSSLALMAVLWLNSVHDAGFVRCGETGGDLGADGDHVVEGELAAGDAVAQRLALHDLHGHEPEAILAADLVDVGDVRMVQSGRRLRFLNEAAHAIGVLLEIPAQGQRDRPQPLRRARFGRASKHGLRSAPSRSPPVM